MSIAKGAAHNQTGMQSSAVQDGARSLIERLQRDGGTLHVENPDDETRAEYRRLIHAAKQFGLVPAGHHLKHTGRNAGDVIIRLVDDAADDDTDWNRIRLNARRVTSSPALVDKALEKLSGELLRVETCLPRALDLIRHLSDEATSRGYKIGINTKVKSPYLYLDAEGSRYRVEVAEQYDEVPRSLTPAEERQLRRNPWMNISQVDRVPNGRLTLRISRRDYGHHPGGEWTDDRKLPLEKRLPKILREIADQIATAREARLEAERAAAERRAEWERKEQETRRQWEQALLEARAPAVETLRRTTFRRAYEAWVTAQEIRRFCDDMDVTAHRSPDAATLREWIAWGRAAAERLYPLDGPPPLDGADFNPEPSADDLRPYLGEWSPHRPQKEYRRSEDVQSLARTREESVAWHHGMIGRPSWWRHR